MGFFSIFCLMFCAFISHAGEASYTVEWKGTGVGKWEDGENWEHGIVPNCYQEAVIGGDDVSVIVANNTFAVSGIVVDASNGGVCLHASRGIISVSHTIPCSGHGVLDPETWNCLCYNHYYGEECETYRYCDDRTTCGKNGICNDEGECEYCEETPTCKCYVDVSLDCFHCLCMPIWFTALACSFIFLVFVTASIYASRRKGFDKSFFIISCIPMFDMMSDMIYVATTVFWKIELLVCAVSFLFADFFVFLVYVWRIPRYNPREEEKLPIFGVQYLQMRVKRRFQYFAFLRKKICECSRTVTGGIRIGLSFIVVALYTLFCVFCIFWYCVGATLYSIRLFCLEDIQKMWLSILYVDKWNSWRERSERIDKALYIREESQESGGIATAERLEHVKEFSDTIFSAIHYHYMLICEAFFESVPQVIIQCVNNANGPAGWTLTAIVSAIFSSINIVILLLNYRVAAEKNVSLRDIPLPFWLSVKRQKKVNCWIVTMCGEDAVRLPREEGQQQNEPIILKKRMLTHSFLHLLRLHLCGTSQLHTMAVDEFNISPPAAGGRTDSCLSHIKWEETSNVNACNDIRNIVFVCTGSQERNSSTSCTESNDSEATASPDSEMNSNSESITLAAVAYETAKDLGEEQVERTLSLCLFDHILAKGIKEEAIEDPENYVYSESEFVKAIMEKLDPNYSKFRGKKQLFMSNPYTPLLRKKKYDLIRAKDVLDAFGLSFGFDKLILSCFELLRPYFPETEVEMHRTLENMKNTSYTTLDSIVNAVDDVSRSMTSENRENLGEWRSKVLCKYVEEHVDFLWDVVNMDLPVIGGLVASTPSESSESVSGV